MMSDENAEDSCVRIGLLEPPRNIWFEHGGKAVVAHVKGQLADDL